MSSLGEVTIWYHHQCWRILINVCYYNSISLSFVRAWLLFWYQYKWWSSESYLTLDSANQLTCWNLYQMLACWVNDWLLMRLLSLMWLALMTLLAVSLEVCSDCWYKIWMQSWLFDWFVLKLCWFVSDRLLNTWIWYSEF